MSFFFQNYENIVQPILFVGNMCLWIAVSTGRLKKARFGCEPSFTSPSESGFRDHAGSCKSVFKPHQLKLNSRKQCCTLASVEMVPCRRRYFLEFSRCTSVLNYSMCFEIMDFVQTKLTAIVTLEPASPLSGFCSTGPSGIPVICHGHHGQCVEEICASWGPHGNSSLVVDLNSQLDRW